MEGGEEMGKYGNGEISYTILAVNHKHCLKTKRSKYIILKVRLYYNLTVDVGCINHAHPKLYLHNSDKDRKADESFCKALNKHSGLQTCFGPICMPDKCCSDRRRGKHTFKKISNERAHS